MVDAQRFKTQIHELIGALDCAKTVLITSPGAADGDSIGAQLALRRMILQRWPGMNLFILNDEPLPVRYQFLPDSHVVYSPETYGTQHLNQEVDVAVILDGGIDRAGRVKEMYDRAKEKVFIDHHAVSIEYPYTIRIVEPTACATTELIYHLSQTDSFKTEIDSDFAQFIYLGLVFDTGFFRHSNTTAEAMELGAKLLRTGFDFTRVGERGMLERNFASLKMMSEILNESEMKAEGKIIWSKLSQEVLHKYGACDDDREGIIDQLFLTHGIEVAVLFFELADGRTKISLRSQGGLDVAHFARSLTEHGGGHTKAAGALIDKKLLETSNWVLGLLENEVRRLSI